VVGADDFASMREILTRRYSRLLNEGAELPDLIVVDGGKGQLSSAYAVLQELGIAESVPIVGLAKRLEEVFYPNDPMPYYLSRTGEPLKVICHIRDEAHRFGITHHRNRRSKNFIKTGLEGIEGVGEKSVTALSRHFRTLSNISKASLDDVAKIVGQAKALKVIEHLQKEKANS
jgi:excinuclease ABC subunit C